MEPFVKNDSITRQIWGKGDTILFIFAGASAEFALNKAVDWLYYTGKLPSDPLGRLFSTVAYARGIVFAGMEDAYAAIDKITAIHKAVEKSRDAVIPDWAYRDVLFMLIHYSIASYELLERKLNEEEKDEVFNVFYRVGSRMGLKDLPLDYPGWRIMQQAHLEKDLIKSRYTTDLFKQYKKHLGGLRFHLLIESQKLVVPQTVKDLLGFKKSLWLPAVLPLYKLARVLKTDWFLKSLILPKAYRQQVKDLDIVNNFLIV